MQVQVGVGDAVDSFHLDASFFEASGVTVPLAGERRDTEGRRARD